MKTISHLWSPIPLTLATLSAANIASAQRGDGEAGEVNEEQVTPFEEARLFFELNDTDDDLGIHALVDGEEWKRLEIEDPNDVRLLEIFVRGSLGQQGLTEVFFESAEPPFDEQAPEDFFRRFPEGIYDIGGITLGGEELDSEVDLSHVMPGPARNVQVSGIGAAENCEVDPLPLVSEPVIISWDPVTQAHPDIGKDGSVEVEHYELVVEREEPTLLVFSVNLPPEQTEAHIPSSFIALGDAFKFEIIVRATNGNQTAIESCFEVQ